MSQMIDDLKSIPGVIGAYTWHLNSGVQASNLPTLFKPGRLNEMAHILNRIHSAGRQAFPDLGDTLICFDEASALCRELSPDTFLVMVCDSSINMNLLTMSLNLAIETYNSDLNDQQSSDVIVAQTVSAEQLKELQTSGPLAKPLQIMSSELFTVMGPMASIVFEENLLDWASIEQPSTSRLHTLLDDICSETRDPEKARKYRILVKNRLGEKTDE